MDVLVPVEVLETAIDKVRREYEALEGTNPGECWAEVEALIDYLP